MYIGEVTGKVAARMGLDPNLWNLTASLVSTLYKVCAFDVAVANDTDHVRESINNSNNNRIFSCLSYSHLFFLPIILPLLLISFP